MLHGPLLLLVKRAVLLVCGVVLLLALIRLRSYCSGGLHTVQLRQSLHSKARGQSSKANVCACMLRAHALDIHSATEPSYTDTEAPARGTGSRRALLSTPRLAQVPGQKQASGLQPESTSGRR